MQSMFTGFSMPLTLFFVSFFLFNFHLCTVKISDFIHLHKQNFTNMTHFSDPADNLFPPSRLENFMKPLVLMPVFLWNMLD